MKKVKNGRKHKSFIQTRREEPCEVVVEEVMVPNTPYLPSANEQSVSGKQNQKKVRLIYIFSLIIAIAVALVSSNVDFSKKTAKKTKSSKSAYDSMELINASTLLYNSERSYSANDDRHSREEIRSASWRINLTGGARALGRSVPGTPTTHSKEATKSKSKMSKSEKIWEQRKRIVEYLSYDALELEVNMKTFIANGVVSRIDPNSSTAWIDNEYWHGWEKRKKALMAQALATHFMEKRGDAEFTVKILSSYNNSILALIEDYREIYIK